MANGRWIETQIIGFFTDKKQLDWVKFAEPWIDGKTWATPRFVAQRTLDESQIREGQKVKIRTSERRVEEVVALDGTNQHQVRQPTHDPSRIARPNHTHATSKPPSSAKPSLLPYGFVPVDLSRTVSDTPVRHDGSTSGELLSGEILCSLETLTPLLAGNARFKVSEADKDALTKFGLDALLGKKEKQIAEPLRLDDGRVLIAGSALKGMIRQSLSTLMSAPMERVGEEHHTYRPNLDMNKIFSPRLAFRPARVVQADGSGLHIEIFDEGDTIYFVRANAKTTIKNAATENGGLSLVQGIAVETNRGSNRIVRKEGGSLDLSGFRTALYHGGIDGEGHLDAAFKKRSGKFTYDLAVIPSAGKTSLRVGIDLYERYLNDQNKILPNDIIGHLKSHPNKANFELQAVQKAIRDNAKLKPGQLIYVELTVGEDGEVNSNSTVTSLGHHFRYRWAYTSSVRKKAGVDRDEIKPSRAEMDFDDDGAPTELTAARNMFGYVRDDKTNPIGKKKTPFTRFAGRIAINHAISEEDPRFLGDEASGYCIPLPILGQPKPSAWEFYLRQDPDTAAPLSTYGDLPHDPGGDLAGRKFYRHQTYEQAIGHIAAGQSDLSSEQATLARHVCDRNTKFKFAIRFARLRKWELGALLAVLEPQLLGHSEKTYAHKLGLGRPLGMGSIKIAIDQVRVRKESEARLPDRDSRPPFQNAAIDALKAKLDNKVPPAWLSMHEFPAGDVDRGRNVDYPRMHESGDIFEWHTKTVRRDYSKLRRTSDPNWRTIRSKISAVNPPHPSDDD